MKKLDDLQSGQITLPFQLRNRERKREDGLPVESIGERPTNPGGQRAGRQFGHVPRSYRVLRAEALRLGCRDFDRHEQPSSLRLASRDRFYEIDVGGAVARAGIADGPHGRTWEAPAFVGWATNDVASTPAEVSARDMAVATRRAWPSWAQTAKIAGPDPLRATP